MDFSDLDYKCLREEASQEMRDFAGEIEFDQSPPLPTDTRILSLIREEGRLWRELRALNNQNQVWRNYFSNSDLIDLTQDNIDWASIEKESKVTTEWAECYKTLKKARHLRGIY